MLICLAEQLNNMKVELLVYHVKWHMPLIPVLTRESGAEADSSLCI